ncbi:MAG: GAF domain-containing protein [Anaerolineaceae bacterium]|nr:GAF domain-containing protein [Anaerolineaceae bacterium]
MHRFTSSSLRSKLLVIALIALIPIMGLIFFTAIDQRQQAQTYVRQFVTQLSVLGASNLSQTIQSTNQLFHTLAQLAPVREGDAAGCSALFSTLLDQYSIYQNFSVSRTDGQIFCSGASLPAPVNLSDRPYFQQALASRELTIGDYQISRISNEPTLVMAYPVIDHQGKLLSVITAALNLSALDQSRLLYQLPSESAVAVLDHNGTILSRSPANGNWVGKSFPDQDLIRTILVQHSGETEITGPDGVMRMYAFTPVDGSQNRLLVTVGIPMPIALATANANLARMLLALVLVAFFVTLIIWFLGDTAFLKPIRILTNAAHEFGQGNLSTRIDTRIETMEFNQLATSFNEMAASLENSTAQIRSAETRFRTLVEHIPAITYRSLLGPSNTRQYISPQSQAILGYSADEWTDQSDFWFEHIHPEDRERVRSEWAQFLSEGNEWLSQYRVRASDGASIWFRDQASKVLPDPDLPGQLQGVMLDVTENRQREREMEALASVASALRNALTRVEMLPIILNQVISLLHVKGALFARQDAATKEILIEHTVGAWSSARGRRIPAHTGITSRVMQSGETYWTNHAADDPVLLRSYFLGNLENAACVPFITHHQTIGVVWIGKEGEITPNDLRVLTAIGDIAASAIQRAVLFEQTQLRLQRLIGLHSIDMAISASLDARLTISMLLDQVTTQLQVDAADVLLLHPELQTLEYAGGRGFNSGQFQNRSLRLGESLAGQVAVDHKPVSIPDLSNSAAQPSARRIREAGEGFKAYFAAPLIAKGQVKGVLEVFHRSPFFPEAEWYDFLETLATQAAIAVDNADLFDRLQRSNDELSLAYEATIEGWSRALELRDHETHGHSHRVTDLSLHLAHKMNYPGSELLQFRRGVLLHDIGKMGVPDRILLKAGPLTQEEWEVMRRHPNYAYEMLSPIPYLRNSLDVPYAHHERWDGSGYPLGLVGDQIPLSARIFAVVDVWDALTSNRPYRKAWPEAKVREYICSRAGIDFDPSVVAAFIQMELGKQKNRANGGCPN